ncbi:MAG TPA: hypothetical protein ENN40_04465 [Candidatus Aminicenantes bacterium]|nr:hypothetical protein [Candidatus Aminicenantes bacterium]
MGLFRKNSGESDASAKNDPDHRFLPPGVPENMEVTVMQMPYYQYTRKELETVHGRLVQLVEDEKYLSEPIADVWIAENPKGATVWIIFKSHIPDSKAKEIFDQLNKISLKQHLGFGSQMLKFAVKEPGFRVLKRAGNCP